MIYYICIIVYFWFGVCFIVLKNDVLFECVCGNRRRNKMGVRIYFLIDIVVYCRDKLWMCEFLI